MSRGLADVARGVVLGGRYRIEDVLGHGGMATVYRAHDDVLDRDVAVKLFPPTDGDEVQRQQGEMRVLARLSHPNLVMLHDAGTAYAGRSAPQTYLVMELVPGPTLADLLATGRLTPAHTTRVGRQLAQALAAVHDAGVVHRDIKPANVLLLQRERVTPAEHPDALTTGPLVKIADFGIARLAGEARLTMTGTTMGTATYLSPEQAAGDDVGPPTDVYALGLVLLECLTGRKAFTGTVMEVAAARLTTDPVIPTALGRDWCELLAGMTARDPADRPSMAEVATRLEAMEPAGPHEPAPAGPGTDSGAPGVAEDVATAPGAVPVPVSTPSSDPPDVGSGADDGTTRRLRTAGILAFVRRAPTLAPSEEGSTRTDRARTRGTPPAGQAGGAEPAGPVGHRMPRLTMVLALTTTLLLAALGALLTGGDEPAPPPELPAVDGELGDALDELADAVTP